MKFSIIVPVYNVEKYLYQCIKSILMQTYRDYEVLLIDDGSTDSSGKMCDEYAQLYFGFSVVHQKNQGLSVARNKGIEMASGDYLLFLDSDDFYLDADCLKKIDQKANGCDIVAFNYAKLWDDTPSKNQFSAGPMASLNSNYGCGSGYLLDALKKQPVYPWYMCIYSVRKKYWQDHGFHFVERKKYEDFDLTYRILLDAGKVRVVADSLYGYRQNRPGAITTTHTAFTYLAFLNTVEKNILDIQKNTTVSEELKKGLSNNFACSYCAIVDKLTLLNKENRKQLLLALKERKWICQYIITPKFKIVSVMCSIFGVRISSYLLNLRHVLGFKYQS